MANSSEWINKIQNTQMLRKYDLEGNRVRRMYAKPNA